MKRISIQDLKARLSSAVAEAGIGQHDPDYPSQRARGAAVPCPPPAEGAFGPVGRRGSTQTRSQARDQRPVSRRADGRPGRTVSSDAGRGRRRLYFDTSAYLCVLLGEEESDRLSEEAARAELLSSVLLVLEARRT